MNDPVWHPILAAVESEPGQWVMIDPLGIRYGDVQLIRRGPGVGYRGRDAALELVGYYRTPKAATRAVHMRRPPIGGERLCIRNDHTEPMPLERELIDFSKSAQLSPQIQDRESKPALSRRSLIVSGAAVALGLAWAASETAPAFAAEVGLGHCSA
jgi:hypothetical protein